MAIKSETPDEARARFKELDESEQEGAQSSVEGQVQAPLFERSDEVQERIDKIDQIGADRDRLFLENSGDAGAAAAATKGGGKAKAAAPAVTSQSAPKAEPRK